MQKDIIVAHPAGCLWRNRKLFQNLERALCRPTQLSQFRTLPCHSSGHLRRRPHTCSAHIMPTAHPRFVSAPIAAALKSIPLCCSARSIDPSRPADVLTAHFHSASGSASASDPARWATRRRSPGVQRDALSSTSVHRHRSPAAAPSGRPTPWILYVITDYVQWASAGAVAMHQPALTPQIRISPASGTGHTKARPALSACRPPERPAEQRGGAAGACLSDGASLKRRRRPVWPLTSHRSTHWEGQMPVSGKPEGTRWTYMVCLLDLVCYWLSRLPFFG